MYEGSNSVFLCSYFGETLLNTKKPFLTEIDY